MKIFDNPQSKIKSSILVTDLDGTFIPLPQNPENQAALLQFKHHHSQQEFSLIFATGRSFLSVLDAIESIKLPPPDWMICDVGTSIYHHKDGAFHLLHDYEAHLTSKVGTYDRSSVELSLASVEPLQLQPQESQQRFKISYLCPVEHLSALVEQINLLLQSKFPNLVCLGSVDPSADNGLIDILPVDVNKSYAVKWLSTFAQFNTDAVIYAGDSGNDYAALIAGFRSILVANASPGLAEQVQAVLNEQQLSDRLFLASKQATSGVLEGCHHFGLFP